MLVYYPKFYVDGESENHMLNLKICTIYYISSENQ